MSVKFARGKEMPQDWDREIRGDVSYTKKSPIAALTDLLKSGRGVPAPFVSTLKCFHGPKGGSYN